MYKTFDKQLNSIKIHLGINMPDLFAPTTEFVREFKATRDVIVHNHGKINGLYIDRVGGSSFSVGDERPLSIGYLENCIRHVNEFLFQLIECLREKAGEV